MRKPYSLELRKRVVAAIEGGKAVRQLIRSVGAKLFFQDTRLT
ncbi:hypothetical protein M2427_007464 [Bradyrhizobium sp. BR13661]|jgi:hypothetical protein|nr:hypothetical protein [Bradyrhizobium sp. BR13661]